MKAVVATLGKFHSFDLARELHKRKYLTAVFTGYPMFKLRNERLPQQIIHTFPWLHTPYMGLKLRPYLGHRINRQWEYLDRRILGNHIAKNLPDCDIVSALSSVGLELAKVVKMRGAKLIIDRGSTHIRTQDNILREEHDRWGLPYHGIDPRIIAREEEEYALADLITVPSSFNIESFISQGVSSNKLRRVPYGVNLSLFKVRGHPKNGRFDVLFVGGINLRKGLPYLLKAFEKVNHPNKRMLIVGTPDQNYLSWLMTKGMVTDRVELIGHVPQHTLAEYMSEAHVMVLPSVEEGLAMVQGQALACGCPVIATRNTGALDLFQDGVSGYIVPNRDVDALATRMQSIADDPELRARMSEAALRQVQKIGGWSTYGDQVSSLMRELCGV